jgi:gamma-glutamyltranspeptidase/glutathione hydrolase
MYSALYGAMRAAFERLAHFPAGRERYLPDGHLVPVGRPFRQPRLAAALERIAEPDGVAWFQRGAFAERFAAAVRASGGALTVADLRAYEPRWAAPVPFAYRGHAFVGSPPPDSGGLYCGFALGVLERTSLPRLGRWEASPRALALIARALAQAGELSARYTADPLTFAIPLEALLAPAFLGATAQQLEGSFPLVDLTPPAAATDAAPPRPAAGGGADLPPTGSNQLVIVDERGDWVSALHTGYAADFGTGLVVDGIGVNAANGFPGVATGAGRRVCTPTAAVLGLRDGRPWLGLGTTGYPPPYVTLALLDLLEYGMSLPEAVDAPRFLLAPRPAGPRPPWDIGQVTVETRVADATVAGLTALGLATAPLGEYGRTGAMHAVLYDAAARQLLGVADPRGTGQAAGY